MPRPVAAQFIRFAIVGASNTAITLATYSLALGAGMRYLPAGALAYALGGVNGFVFNRRWTFAHRGHVIPAAARYSAIQAGGIVLNLLLLRGVVALGVPHAAAEIAAIAPVTLITFSLNRAWAFASAPPQLVRSASVGDSRAARSAG